MQDGDFVWTRDSIGGHWLGRIEGQPWHFDGDPEARTLDLTNVRGCRWLEQPFRDYRVPGQVVRSFTGPGDTLRRIPGQVALNATENLWAQGTGSSTVPHTFTPTGIVREILDASDLEDVALMLL
jgi:hypothetical protein